MDIRVSAIRSIPAMRSRRHVADRLQGIADKYFSRAISAQVTFGKGPHDNGFTCDIVAHVMQGLVLKAQQRRQDAHLAFDGAADKIEKQLRRYKRRLKDRHDRRGQRRCATNGADDNAGYTVFQRARRRGRSWPTRR